MPGGDIIVIRGLSFKVGNHCHMFFYSGRKGEIYVEEGGNLCPTFYFCKCAKKIVVELRGVTGNVISQGRLPLNASPRGSRDPSIS